MSIVKRPSLFGLLARYAADARRHVPPTPVQPLPATWSDEALTVSWLGHATVLANIHGLNVLIDPVLFSRCGVWAGPVAIGPKRYVAPALSAKELPRIDLVLLTHAHFDHFDTRSLRAVVRRNPTCIAVTAGKTVDLLRGIQFRAVHELNWNQTNEFVTDRGAITISAFKLAHWGARVRVDTHRCYNAYVLERNGSRFAHFGDTARFDASALSSRGSIDVACVPVGGYNPWLASHCTPEEAATMCDEARADLILPIHHHTFRLSYEPMDEPIERFQAAIAADRLAVTQIGGTATVPK